MPSRLFNERKGDRSVGGEDILRLAGKALMILGFTLAVLGGVIMAAQKVPWIGKLPGDIFVKRAGFSFYFPVTTCIIVSVVLSLVFYLLSRFK